MGKRRPWRPRNQTQGAAARASRLLQRLFWTGGRNAILWGKGRKTRAVPVEEAFASRARAFAAGIRRVRQSRLDKIGKKFGMPPGAVTAMHQKATGARKQFTWLSRKLKGRGKIPTVLHEAMHFVSDYQSLGNNSILASALDRYVSNARLHKMVPTLEAPLYAVSEASDPAILKWLRKSRETENLPEYEPIIKRHDNTVSSFKECGDLVGDALHAIDRVSGKPLAGLTALRIVLLDPHLDFMMALGEIERGDRDGWIEETKQIVSEELRRGREKQFEKKK